MNENMNLIGYKVNSFVEAMAYLQVSQNKIILQENEINLNGVTFNTFVYTAEGCKNWCYSVNASNLNSNQFN